ncbi:MAG: tRNA adenosine(34) deaminase TadA [Cyclonatronaceae bacterium]
MPDYVNILNLDGPELHRHFMKLALIEAQKAFDAGEVPVGAVLVRNRRVLSRAHNEVEARRDVSAHAELLALRRACRQLGVKYLSGCTLYVSLEPCPMCAGALLWSKIQRLVFATPDAKAGASGSLFNITANQNLNHQIEVIQGVCEAEASQLLRQFFGQRRGRSSS